MISDVEGKWIKNSRIAWAKENNKSIFDCERPKKHEIVKVKNKSGVVEKRELKYIGSQMAQGVVDEMKSNLKTILRLTKTKKTKTWGFEICIRNQIVEFGTIWINV